MLLAGALLGGCQEFNRALGRPDGPAQPSREQRLQAIESKLVEVGRKVDNLGLASQQQNLTRLEAEVRELRGEVEKLRFDFDTSEVRARDLYEDLDRRLKLLETTRLSADPRTVQQPAAAASQEEETAYLAAFDQLKAGKYEAASKGFKDVLARWPQGRYADNAWYWSGEANYIRKSYDAALDSFRKLLAQFPSSSKVPDALYKIGLCQLEKKQKNDARATWKRLVAEHPGSNAAGLAKQKLEQTK